jgi:CARDB
MTSSVRLHVLRALGLALAVALLAAAAPAAPAAVVVTDGPAGAHMLACRTSPSIDQRVAVVGTWMKPLPGAQRLTLKLDLFQRQQNTGAKWTQRTDVPGLGTWTAPSDALFGTRAGDVFKYRQAVGRLVLGYAYRFRVSFRWLDAAGAVVRESTFTTRACRQPGPDLVVSGVKTEPSLVSPGAVRYLVTVLNRGRAPVARAVLAGTYPGEATVRSHRRRVGRLVPGSWVTIGFTGPPCTAGDAPPTFVVDPDGLVEETDEANNQFVGACPAP